MINANELRRGNLVFWNPKLANPGTTIPPTIIEVETIATDKIGYITPNVEHRSEPFEDDVLALEPGFLPLKELEPIPLTEDFLEKAGFLTEHRSSKAMASDTDIAVSKVFSIKAPNCVIELRTDNLYDNEESRFSDAVNLNQENWVNWYIYLKDGNGYSSTRIKPIQNLHQLQNRYILITGKELDIRI